MRARRCPGFSRTRARSLRSSTMASTRAVLQVFEKYQKDRVAFVQTVAELATRPQNIEPMQSAGVMALLRPLLLDNVPRCVERDGVETRDRTRGARSRARAPTRRRVARGRPRAFATQKWHHARDSSARCPPDSFPRSRAPRADRPPPPIARLRPPALPPPSANAASNNPPRSRSGAWRTTPTTSRRLW